MEMERKRIYCSRWSFVSETDHVIETLSLCGMSGSRNLPKLFTGRCPFCYETAERIEWLFV